MQRVMIVGQPGSGKSTLAVRLGKHTGLPVFHMDRIHYEPGWVERSRERKSELTQEIHVLPQWIFEGNHSATYEARIARADTVVWLDYPLGLRLFRVIRRAWRYHGRTRPDLPADCQERFNWQFLDFIGFILRTCRRNRARLHNRLVPPPSHIQLFHLRGDADVENFINQVVLTDAANPGASR